MNTWHCATVGLVAVAAGCKQPQTLLAIPDGATPDALLASWRRTKKPADLVLVFDRSLF